MQKNQSYECKRTKVMNAREPKFLAREPKSYSGMKGNYENWICNLGWHCGSNNHGAILFFCFFYEMNAKIFAVKINL